MPISPGLVTLADVKTETNITADTDDNELQGYIDAATAVLLNHPAYRIADATSATSYTEWHDGGRDTLILKHHPVDPSSVTITEYTGAASQLLAYEPADGTSFTAFGWVTDDGAGENGILRRTSSGYPRQWCGRRVKVEYTAGAASVPADIRLAVLTLIDHLWEMQRGTAPGGLPAGIETESASGIGGQAYGPSFALPPRVTELLEPYRREPAVA